MMEMLKLLRLAVFVACIAAFASGCGGGGGTAEEAQVMECPQGQVGTYPNCTDPPPTDEERIDAAQDTLAGIIADAQTREQLARADASAVQAHDDATEAQKTSAGNLGDAARNALTDIVTASAVVNVATTGAQAEGAVDDARTALNDLISAQTSLASLLSTVNAVADARRQLERDEELATNGSSLIKHVRDNRKVYDGVLDSLGTTSITVGVVADGVNEADYPAHTGGTRTVYPRPGDADGGMLGVTITVGTTAVSSSGLTATLSGVGRLSQGLDLKNADDTLFANAYTDIAVDRRVSSGIDDNPATTDIQEQYVYAPDADYLLAGIWLDDSDATPELRAFAYGSENITTAARASDLNRCSATQSTSPNSCTEATGFQLITNFVSAGNELSATYRGGASGAYLAGGLASYFSADVELNAVFRNVGGDVAGSNISGEVTNIVAGGKSIDGSIDLIRHPLGTDLGARFTDGTTGDPSAVGVIAGENYSGRWTGQFFGKRTKGSPTSVANADGRDYTYQPDAPNSVAGAFYVIKQSAPAGDAAFLGSFGAFR